MAGTSPSLSQDLTGSRYNFDRVLHWGPARPRSGAFSTAVFKNRAKRYFKEKWRCRAYWTTAVKNTPLLVLILPPPPTLQPPVRNNRAPPPNPRQPLRPYFYSGANRSD